MFTVPDKGEGLHDNQSIWFQEHIDALVAGIAKTRAVISGCAVTVSGTTDVAYASGEILTDGIQAAVTGSTYAGAIPDWVDATNPRFVLVTVGMYGSVTFTVGTAAVAPKPPTSTDTHLALIYVPAGATSLSNANIIDMRVFREASGARGAGGDSVFYENDQTVDNDYTITSGKNAMSAGPITVSTGVTVTVPTGSTWTIV